MKRILTFACLMPILCHPLTVEASVSLIPTPTLHFTYAMAALLIVSLFIIVVMFLVLRHIREQNAALMKARKHLHTAEELLARDTKIDEMHERLNRIIDTSPLVCVLMVGYKVAGCNFYMQNIFKMQLGDDIRRYWPDVTHLDELLSRVTDHAYLTDEVIQLRLPDGTVHRFLSNFTTVDYEGELAHVLWAIDIEERETRMVQLQTARQSLQTLFDTLPIPLRITDIENDSILYANQSAADLFEYNTPEDTYNKPFSTFVPPFQSDGTPSVEKVLAFRNSRKTNVMEIDCLTGRGNIIEVRFTVIPINYHGIPSTVGIMQDMSSEKAFRRMILNAAEKETEANQLKSKFLVNMSHEIRTPMNAIIGLTEIELRRHPPREVREVYRKINDSAKNLLDIINDILDLSKIEANKMELMIDEFELEDVFSSALLVATPRLEGKNVEFILKTSLDLPRYVMGDRTRVWQILKNFLDNSAKYTEEGTIILNASLDPDRSDDQTACIVFMIEDTGVGISDEQMSRLFLPYEQFYNDAQKKYSGTGLGMAISKQLCEIMNGELQVASLPGLGTTVHITIPFARSKNNETERLKIQSPALAGTEILLVDDDDTSLEIMTTLLKCSGVNCATVHSGEEAVETVFKRRDAGLAFDLILLDYMLGGIDGLETAKQIQAGLSKAPKLLMVTAYQRQLLKNDLDNSGIEDVIEKPLIPSHFIQRLGAALGYAVEAEPEDVLTVFRDTHILLCEDNQVNQEVASGMLQYFGIVPVVAENGQEALALLNNAEPDAFDLVLMDLQMPVMDGYEATGAIRANPRFDALPIISLTADAMPEIVERCLSTGMNDHLAKPLGFAKLNAALLRWLPADKRAATTATPSNEANEALARFGGDHALYTRALRDFASGLPEVWDFEDAVRNQKRTLLYVHNLKGVAGSLCEDEIYRRAAGFETALRANTATREEYEALQLACDSARQRIFAEFPAETQPLSPGTREEFTALFEALRAALLDYSPLESGEAVRGLQSKAWSFAVPAELEKLCALTLDYEFDGALALLDTIEWERESECPQS